MGVYEKYLADDFKCTESGPITGIHVWGSYRYDLQIDEVPLFNLAIYEDVPVGPGNTLPYSHPGRAVWSGYGLPAAIRPYAATPQERFFDPNTNQIIGYDYTVWQFNFQIPEDMAFRQEVGKIYWLGVNHSFDLNGDGVVDITDLGMLAYSEWAYGWKTSDRHYNDDAVWTDVDTYLTNGRVVPGGPWRELIDPGTGASLDLAFVITPEPGVVGLLLVGGGVALLRRKRD
jgi:hypothetical protein